MRKIFVLLLTAVLMVGAVLVSVFAEKEETTRFLVRPTMDYFMVDAFYEGRARVEYGDKCGFIDKAGKLVIPLEYDADRWTHFSEGLALVYVGGEYIPASQRIMEGGKCGFIDKEGNIVVPIEYDRAWSFSDGVAVVEKNGQQSLIDKEGKTIAELKRCYDYIDAFSEGLALVTVESESGDSVDTFINKEGKEILPLGYYGSFSEGLAVTSESYPTGDEYSPHIYASGYIDRTGKVVIPLEYESAYSFSDGLAVVRKDIKYGVIDKTGKVVIPFEYDWFESSSDDMFVAAKDGKYGVVDKTGKVVIPFEYDGIGEYSEGLMSFSKDGKYGYMDETGKVVISLARDHERASFAGGPLSPFRDGFAVIYAEVQQSGSVMDMGTYAKWGVIDKTGKEIIPLEYDSISYLGDGLAIVFSGYADFYHYFFSGTWGIVQLGEGVLPSLYDAPSSWAVEQVDAAVMAGLVPAELQSKYTQAITRAEFCALAVELYEKHTGQTIAERVKFDDTSDINVEKMAAMQVVNGVGSNKFSPDDPLTREQAAVMLSRLADAIGSPLTGHGQSADFSDNASISDWAAGAVRQVRAAGIMDGVGNNTFAPQAQYTREQSILTIMRLYSLLNK